MLNPSTADAEKDDPTIRKCIGFAKRMGYGGLVVVNLYAYRATKPAQLREAGYPLNSRGDVPTAMRDTALTICAWGRNAPYTFEQAKDRFRCHNFYLWASKCWALSLTKDGIPAHPLMLPYSCADNLIKL